MTGEKTLVIIDNKELDELKEAINKATKSFDELVEEFRQFNETVSSLNNDED